jgi:hypothetical protein
VLACNRNNSYRCLAPTQVIIKLENAEPEQLSQDLITAVNKAMNEEWVLTEGVFIRLPAQAGAALCLPTLQAQFATKFSCLPKRGKCNLRTQAFGC